MKNLPIAFLFIILSFFLFSCDKEKTAIPSDPAIKETTEEVNPVAVKILEEAQSQDVKLCSFSFDDLKKEYTFFFHEIVVFEKGEYAKIALDAKYVSSIDDKKDGIVIVLKNKETIKISYFNEIKLSLDKEMSFSGYPHEKVDIPFNIIEAGRGNLEVSLEKGGGLEGSVQISDNQGLVTLFCPFSEGEKGMTAIVASDGVNREEYKVSLTSYHFSASGETIILSGEAGSKAPVVYSLDTDIPDCDVALTVEDGTFVSVANGFVEALSANETLADRETMIIISESSGKVSGKGSIKVIQKPIPVTNKPECVPFADRAFKNAMLKVADKDNDGEISKDEALLVQELNLSGAGIENLTGLDWFKNAWKFDGSNNNIVDATLLKELPLLHWLDLTGNKNLKTFDVTGCTIWFEYFEYEHTEDLLFYTTRNQMRPSEFSYEHCRTVFDERSSIDFSRQNELVLLKEHTVGEGKYPIVFSGIGWLDVDFKDGSYERILNEVINALKELVYVKPYWEYFDIYYMIRISDNRLKYFELDKPGGENYQQVLMTVWGDIAKLYSYCYEALFGDEISWPVDENKAAIFLVNLPAYPKDSIVSRWFFPGWSQGSRNEPKLKSTLNGECYLNGNISNVQNPQNFNYWGPERGIGGFREHLLEDAKIYNLFFGQGKWPEDYFPLLQF